MTNYIINECLTNDVYIISATTLTAGDIIKFTFGEDVFCGEVMEVTEDPLTSGYEYGGITYENCCNCLTANTVSLSFKFITCDTEEEFDIESTNFCIGYGAPTTGLTYEIQLNTDTPFCATFLGLGSRGSTNYSYVSGPSLSCEDCENPPPISAGTEYNVCIIDCSGNTVSISPPHPTWTNEQGHAVVLLDAIALGGMNGLNS